MESGFHATATVYKANGTTQDYNATTLPSDNSLFGTIKEGLYEAKLGTHPMSGGYPALNIYTTSGSRFIPTYGGGTNPSGGGVDGNLKTVDGVNVHKVGINEYLGTYKRSNGTIGGISEGCLCIERGPNDVIYNNFISNFQSGQTVGIGVLRDMRVIEQKTLIQVLTEEYRKPNLIENYSTKQDNTIISH